MNNNHFGYARVSTIGQNLDGQIIGLRERVIEENIYTEKATGTSLLARPVLTNLLDNILRRGDKLYVPRLDRLARSTIDLANIAEKLKGKGVDLVIMDNAALDTSTIAGALMFTVLGAIAQFETELRRERQLVGIQNAKAKGIYTGRKPIDPLLIQEVISLRDEGMSITKACKQVGLSTTAYYKHLKTL